MKKVVIAYALEAEKVHFQKEGFDFVYIQTNVGKVNAAIAVQQAIYAHQPDYVLNIGTCGSLHKEVGSIFTCHTFIDRDMEKLVEFGLTCREEFVEEINGHSCLSDWEYNAICNTGDTFLTSKDGTGDVFDMEAYAIARVCKTQQLPFAAIKYVTDKIGENSVKVWEDKLHDARVALQEFVDQLDFKKGLE